MNQSLHSNPGFITLFSSQLGFRLTVLTNKCADKCAETSLVSEVWVSVRTPICQMWTKLEKKERRVLNHVFVGASRNQNGTETEFNPGFECVGKLKQNDTSVMPLLIV